MWRAARRHTTSGNIRYAHPDDFNTAVLRGMVERGEPVPVCAVRVAAAPQKLLHNVLLAAPGSLAQLVAELVRRRVYSLVKDLELAQLDAVAA